MSPSSSPFLPYETHGPLVPVVRVTDPSVPAIHRFYDTSPISPSGNLLAVTELATDDRLPAPDDVAHVVVLDLRDGRRLFTAATTAWDTQVGAHAQWGASDRQLFFNVRDGIDEAARAVVADPTTGSQRTLHGAVTMASPDGTVLLAPDLEKLSLVQAGYGVRPPDPEVYRHRGFPADDGLFATSVASGGSRLLLSHEELARRLPNAFGDVNPEMGGLYGFHVKWHSRGDRILYLVRWLDEKRVGGSTRNWLVSLAPDGDDVRLVLDWRRWRGGHHPTWFPSAHDVVMNLGFDPVPWPVLRGWRFGARAVRRLGIRLPIPGRLHFARIPGDGGAPSMLAARARGSGHPSLDPSERFLVTDAYPDEAVAAGDGTVPLRLVELATGEEHQLVRIRTQPTFRGPRGEWRVDPHPAWSRDGRYLAFNACPDGVRGVFIAEVGPFLDGLRAEEAP